MSYIIRPDEVVEGVYDQPYASDSEARKQLYFRVTLKKDKTNVLIGSLSYFVKHKNEIVFTTDHFIQALNKFNSIIR